MTTLVYKHDAMIEDLAVGECTLRRTGQADGRDWWMLWFYAVCNDGQTRDLAVPVAVNGDATESGPGGRTWGLRPIGQGSWQVSPSINVIRTDDGHALHQGEHPTAPSLWHETPQIAGVPVDEPWENGAAP